MDGLIFIYFIIFPFGKLLGTIPDLLIILIVIFSLRSKIIQNGQKQVNALVTIFIFSLFFSLSFFNLPQIFTGFLYLVRLISYIFFSQIILQKFSKEKSKKELIFNSLISIGIFIAIFGWIQYFLFPDLRALKTLGWDDHYFRLTSTFLDPAFTGILLVLTEVLVLIKTIKKQSKTNYFINLFLIITILLTYSRSSFLSLFFSVLFLLFKFKKKFLLFLLVLFILIIPFLPKTSGEGTNLARTNSINQKFINYQESIDLIKKSPIFGVGFNNLCIAKNSFLNKDNALSHTCSGLDNSVMFIMATTGVVGLIIFIQLIFSIIKNTELNLYGWGLIVSFVAIFIHGMFTNTFFYNFVLGWMAILIGVTRVKD